MTSATMQLLSLPNHKQATARSWRLPDTSFRRCSSTTRIFRIQAKRTALDSISTRRADSVNLEGLTGGYDTNNDTKPRSQADGFAQVVEKMVDLSGIEPLASSLRTRRSPS